MCHVLVWLLLLQGGDMCDPGRWSDALERAVQQASAGQLQLTGGFYCGTVTCPGLDHQAAQEEALRIADAMEKQGTVFAVRAGVQTSPCPVLGGEEAQGEGSSCPALGVEEVRGEGSLNPGQGVAGHGQGTSCCVWVVCAEATLSNLCKRGLLEGKVEDVWAPEPWHAAL